MKKRPLLWCFLILLLSVIPYRAKSQSSKVDGGTNVAEDIPLQVFPIRQLSFGAFYPGRNGGEITIDPSGALSSKGDVVFFFSEMQAAPGIIEVRAEPFSMIHLNVDNSMFLSHLSGDKILMQIIIDRDFRDFVFVPQSGGSMQIYFGGRLIVRGNKDNAPGSYHTYFSINVIKE